MSDAGAFGRVSADYSCSTIGCDRRVPLRDLRVGARGVYCPSCSPVERAIFARENEAAVVEEVHRGLDGVREHLHLATSMGVLPCFGCRWRSARVGTFSCSSDCVRSIRQYGRRRFKLVHLHGVALPEQLWLRLLGIRPSTYRMRRRKMEVVDALTRRISTARSRAGRARHDRPLLFDDAADVHAHVAIARLRFAH